MRAILGIIAGLIASMVATVVVGSIGVIATLRGPVNGDLTDANGVVEAFANMPLGPKLALMAGWFAGGLAGALVAKAIARRSWAGWIVAGLLALYVLANVLILPLPSWMQVLSIAAPLIGGLIGNHLIRDAAAPAVVSTTDAGDAPAEL
jgi:hypothetical protein